MENSSKFHNRTSDLLSDLAGKWPGEDSRTYVQNVLNPMLQHTSSFDKSVSDFSQKEAQLRAELEQISRALQQI